MEKKVKMYEFKYEATGHNKQELIKDIEILLDKMKHGWPVLLCNDPKWVKQQTDEAWLKVDGGYKRQTLTFIY